MDRSFLWLALFSSIVLPGLRAKAAPAAATQDFDVVIKNGTVYDGSGGDGRQADVALRGDRIAGVGDFKDAPRPS